MQCPRQLCRISGHKRYTGLNLDWNPTHFNKFQVWKCELWNILWRCYWEIGKTKRMCLVGGIVPGGKSGIETLISGSAISSWIEVHTSKEEIRQKYQETCTDEQGVPGKTQTQKGSIWEGKQRQACEEYRSIIWACRYAVRKYKTQMELSMARNVKDNRKGFLSS